MTLHQFESNPTGAFHSVFKKAINTSRKKACCFWLSGWQNPSAASYISRLSIVLYELTRQVH